ncbi:LruC domain-containing protein [Shewanella gelidii]|uniref:LruC domain-containing protein n=1 Tax=Shewanella gelidii TaxID=1642821 RepID=A0A917N6X5_9GAMM|nr:LruC domain-containing protein [Shewanella gelidii]MCL1096900.1 LruC domain-containing protein [Shewanella gelidii]GGI70999.1 LruC domain-containing protein [Shewanella gelidii]
MKYWPILTACIAYSGSVVAQQAFQACPTQAFIVQSPAKYPILYGVNLGTGSYATLSADMGIDNSLNGVGFSYQDNFLYGWDYQHQTLGKAGSDYQSLPLNIEKDSAAANAGNFYVGDVAINENTWYGYRRGKGLFKIELDNPNRLQMTQVSGSAAFATYSITDFAFHPNNGLLYAVSNGTTGTLLEIDPSSGQATELGVVLVSTQGKFTFGAQFFDPDGNLYVSNNGDGNIYRIHVEHDSPVGELFSYGPSSSTNDGARCALAEVPVGNNVDFGDAPDSYGTLIASNGARHQISEQLYLGSRIDNEADGYPHPLSDDDSRPDNDEDGIQMPTGLEIGEQAVMLVSAHGTGYLNAWFDWDQNGHFDSDEIAISGHSISNGTHTVNIEIPSWAKAGETWARFRLSSIANINPTGGVSDGEVEDYAVTLTETGVSINYYPSASSYTSIAYEDLYPDQGDFDMNDVVMHLRIAEYVKDGQVRRIGFEAELAAMGAAYHNGFAIQLPNITRDRVKESQVTLYQQGVRQTAQPLEADQTYAVLIFTDDLWQQVSTADECLYFRTEPGCGTQYRASWQMTVPFVTPIDQAEMPSFPYDPFIFATPNMDHGLAAKNIAGGHPGRKLEIHLKNKMPTDRFEQAYFGQRDDASSLSQGQTFQDHNGMSWAIEIPMTWQHPLENQRLDDAYRDFIHFAADESQTTATRWYLNPTLDYVFKD